MKRYIAIVLCLLTLGAVPALAQWTPFGVDAEIPQVPNGALCNHNAGCQQIDQAAKAGAQWISFLAVWYFLEPQQNTFSWGELPWQIWYAQQKGMSVYLKPTWAPRWANGATSTNPPFGSNCGDCGRAVADGNYTWTFFYNLATQFNGSTTSGCPTNNVPVTRSSSTSESGTSRTERTTTMTRGAKPTARCT